MTYEGFGYKIDGNGTVSALTSPAHHGRPTGRLAWIGSVRRMGSGWAASDTHDVTTHGFKTQKAAAESLYEPYVAARKKELGL